MIKEFDSGFQAKTQVGVVHQLLDALLLEQAVDVRHLLGQVRIENDAAHGGLNELALELDRLDVRDVLRIERGGQVDGFPGVAQTNGGEQFDFTGFKSQRDVFRGTEHATFALSAGLGLGQVIDTENHVLRRNGERQTVRGRQNVARAQHEHRRFHLRFRRERNVHGHLVAVEVRVESGANERVNADGFAFDESRFEGLNAEAVQGRGAVEKHGMLADDIFEDVPHDGFLLLDHFLGLLDGGAVPLGFELVIDERLEELERHLLGQTALVEFEFRANDDDGTAGIVDALAEEVLAETALLALERIAEGLQRTVVGATQNAATAAIVEQRVNGFLQHALFVADDNVWRAKFHELLQPVVAVDDAAIEVVEIRSGETAAIERHQGTQLRRKNRDHVQDHPFGLVAALAEGFENLEALGELDALLERRIRLHLFAQLIGKLFDFDAAQQFLDGFGAHLGGELAGIFGGELAIFLFLKDLALFQDRNFALIDDDEGFEVEDALEIAHGNVQQVADAAGQALEEPNVRARGCQLNVAQALTAHFAEGDFHAALIADDSAMLHALVFSAQTFPVRHRTENFGAEQTITLGLERTVVDGLRLGDFTVRPRTDFFRTGQADTNGIEIGDQTGAIIRAAAIQGDFLPPRLSPGTRLRQFEDCPWRLRTQTSGYCRYLRTCRDGAQNIAPLPGTLLVGCFFYWRFLALHQLDVET